MQATCVKLQIVTNFVDGASIAAGSSDGCVYICSHVNKEDGSKSWEFKGKFKVSKLENTQIYKLVPTIFFFFKVCFAVCFVVDSIFFVGWLVGLLFMSVGSFYHLLDLISILVVSCWKFLLDYFTICVVVMSFWHIAKYCLITLLCCTRNSYHLVCLIILMDQ